MTPYVISGLEFGPVVIERVLRQIDPKAMEKPAGEGRFTPREVAAHLADWEPILHGRIKQTVDSPGSVLVAYDEVQRGKDMNYTATDPFDSAQAFAKHRQATVEYLKGLEAADWEKSSIHPERGVMTVREWVMAVMGHDTYHVEQLTAVW